MTTAPSSIHAGLRRHGAHWPWHRQLPAQPAISRRANVDSLATFCVVLASLTLGLAGFVAFVWIAIHVVAPPLDANSFDRWWFFPAALFLSCGLLGAYAFRRTGQRSGVVVGLVSLAGLVGVLPFFPYF